MYEELADTAVLAAREGAQVLLGYFRGGGLEARSKGDHDFVTRADHESEDRVLATLRRAFPDHQVLAEERGWDESDSEYCWYVDPLDGTSNFMQGLPVFSISIACRHRDEMVAGVVYDPLGDNLFTAVRGGGARWNGRPMRVSERPRLHGAFLATGYPFKSRAALDLYLAVFRAVFLEARAIRRCGSAALDLAYTAAGVYDGFFELRLAPWDVAAGALLVREAGGRVTDLDGGGGFFDAGNVIAGGPELHRELLATVHAIVDEARMEAVDPARNKSPAHFVER
ncbi:MAG TPA: inositol monophosphatase family protein [Thermoanaerobaculia bacterium]|jgi:myo-inositol-1(or 4)-monophosphatase